MQGKWREQDKVHACGESMKKHGELNDPFCYQLGFLDAYTHLKAENERLQREANQAIFEREKSASDHVKKYEALQTQNAKLKAALEKIASTTDPLSNVGPALKFLEFRSIARTTLAEIGGDDA